MVKRLLLAVIAPALLLGCSNTKTITVAVPPRVDLAAYRTIGLVGFSSNANDELANLSTQKFLEAVQSAQPGTRVVELGSEQQVLSSVNARTWTPATLRAIKQANSVDAIVIGKIDLEKPKADLKLSTVFKQMSVNADVEAKLGAKLLETDSGATMWSDSSEMTTSIARADFNNRGEGFFGARDPEAVYGKMINQLVYQITHDFRTHYVKRRVPKDHVETASARD